MIAVSLLLGGTGSRFGGPVPKQFYQAGQLPVFAHTAKNILRNLHVDILALTVHPEYLESSLFQEPFSLLQRMFSETTMIAGPGGKERTGSFKASLELLKPHNPSVLLVHDANRPFLYPDFFYNIKVAITRLKEEPGCYVPAIQSVDSMLRADGDSAIEYMNRNTLFRVQTPQVMPFAQAVEAVQAVSPDIAFTDEGSLFIAAGKLVKIFPGDPANLKITYQKEAEKLHELSDW